MCCHGKRPAQLRLAAVCVAHELGWRTCMAGCWQVLHGAQWLVKNVSAHWSVFKQSCSCPERPSWCTSVISNPTLGRHLVFLWRRWFLFQSFYEGLNSDGCLCLYIIISNWNNAHCVTIWLQRFSLSHVQHLYLPTSDWLSCLYEALKWLPDLVLLTWCHVILSCLAQWWAVLKKKKVQQTTLRSADISKLLKSQLRNTRLCPWKLQSTLQSTATIYNLIHLQCFATNPLVFAISLPRRESE